MKFSKEAASEVEHKHFNLGCATYGTQKASHVNSSAHEGLCL